MAPIVPEAWEEIDREAKRVLELNLAGRKVVDFDGPHGWKLAAVNLGELSPVDEAPAPGVNASLRASQPLIELRAPLRLSRASLDGAARGAARLDLGPVVDAAEAIAAAEDRMIFRGYATASIRGILEAAPHAPLSIPSSPERYADVILEAREVLREAGINGPYALALGTKDYKELSLAAEQGYPIRKRIEQHIIDGPLVWAPAVEGAVLLSVRGGDFVLTVGQDLAIGYVGHDRDFVDLYLTESLTFRVLEEAAAVALRRG
jgi:uncharacterized linocin/CFP29 family protein